MKVIGRKCLFVSLLVLMAGSIVNSTSLIARDKNYLSPIAKPSGDIGADEFKIHNVGLVWNAESNFGAYGDANQNMPSFEWPGGSENHYNWEGRFWVGAIIDGKKRVSHADYGNYEFHATEDFSFTVGQGKSIQDMYCGFDDLTEQGGHYVIGLKIQQRALAWSMPEYDDFIAYEIEVINEGTSGKLYNLFVGWNFDCDVAALDATEPHIDDLVDYDGWDGADTDTDLMDVVDPLDLDCDGLTGYDEWGIPYGWDEPDNPNRDPSKSEPDGVYDEYHIYLDKNGPVIYGQPGTNFAGQPLVNQANGDTLRGYLLSRNMSYIFDGDHKGMPGNDMGERELATPCDGFIGGRLIYTPHAAYNTTADDTLPRPYAHSWWNWNSDPGNDNEKYEYMAALHEASMGFNFVPNPHNPKIGAPVFDYRWLTSTGPFDLDVEDTLRFVYVVSLGKGLEGLRKNIDKAMEAYYSGSNNSNPARPSDFVSDNHWVLPVPPPIPQLNYSVNSNSVTLVWDNSAETAIDPMLGTVDFEGYKVYRTIYSTTGWEMIYACDNVDGIVTVRNTDGDSIGTADLPDITHTFIDSGGVFLGREIEAPINGLPYYYSVVAYDPYKPATSERPELFSQESSKSNYLVDTDGVPEAVRPQKVYDHVETVDLHDIKVVPNPYRGTNLFEAKYEDIITFTHLPPACKITILSVAGDIIKELYHSNGTESENWDLKSDGGLLVASGLYFYVVETEDDNMIGKLVVLRGR